MSEGSRPPAAPRREREDGPVCCLASSSGGDGDEQEQEEEAAQQRRDHAAATRPHAAIVLSEWLGLIGDDPTSVGLLALLIRAGAAPPRHVALLAAALREADGNSDSDSLRLQALQGLGALPPRLVLPHIPLIAATIARLLRARPAGTRAAALGALNGLLQQQQQQQQQQQLACRGPDADAEAAAAAPLLALHPTVAALAARDAASPVVRIRALECLGRLPLRQAALHLGGALLPRLADTRMGVQAAALAALEALRARGGDDDEEDGARRFSEALSRHVRCLVGLFMRGGETGAKRGRRRRKAAVFAVGEGPARRAGDKLQRTRLAVLQVLSSFVPPAALVPHVGELAAAVGWTPPTEQGKEEESHQQPPTRWQLRTALAPMPLGSPSSSPSRSRSFSPRARSCPGSPSSSSPATAMAMAAAGGLRPRPRRLVFEEDKDEEEQGQEHTAELPSLDDDDDDDDGNNQQQDEAVQAGLLALLGTLPTAPVLPHLAPVARRFLLPRLLVSASDAEAAGGAAAAVRAWVDGIRNPELRRQCLSHLFVPPLLGQNDGGRHHNGRAAGTAAATSRRRRGLLRLLLSDGGWGAKALFPLLPAETSALAACLSDPCEDVRRDACLLLLQSARAPYDHHHHSELKGLSAVAVCMGAAGAEGDKENARLLVGREQHTALRWLVAAGGRKDG